MVVLTLDVGNKKNTLHYMKFIWEVLNKIKDVNSFLRLAFLLRNMFVDTMSYHRQCMNCFHASIDHERTIICISYIKQNC